MRDITKSVGTTQFFVANLPFPVRPIDHSNKAGVMLELAAAWNNVSSIDSFILLLPLLSSQLLMGLLICSRAGKFYLGVNTERWVLVVVVHPFRCVFATISYLCPCLYQLLLLTFITALFIAVYDALLR
jgi:hypothetical protein